jgi:hypothetical protein
MTLPPELVAQRVAESINFLSTVSSAPHLMTMRDAMGEGQLREALKQCADTCIVMLDQTTQGPSRADLTASAAAFRRVRAAIATLDFNDSDGIEAFVRNTLEALECLGFEPSR